MTRSSAPATIAGAVVRDGPRVYILNWTQPVIHVPAGEMIYVRLHFTLYPPRGRRRPFNNRAHQNKHARHKKGIRR